MSEEKQTYNQIAGRRPVRIEALSDGVFAIAMTLLILEIHVPSIEGEKTENGLIHAFFQLAPEFLSYLLGFVTLGIFWTGQSTQHSFLNKSDRHLSWINVLFLMFICLLPFSTAFLNEYIEFKFSVFLYWFNILCAGIIIYWHWHYAMTHQLVNLDSEQVKVIDKAIRRRVIMAQSLYFCGAMLCFISTYLSIGVIILIQLNYAFAFKFRGKTLS